MKSSTQHAALPQVGFTLVEVMVGLTIGMLAAIVIMQVFSVFEAQKRTTTGTADAQTNGNIALYNIGRELQLAGYPLIANGEPNVADSAIECTALNINGIASTPNRLSPVTITDGISDSITIRYGNSDAGGIPTQITGVGNPTANDVALTTNFGCLPGNTTLIIDKTTANCAISSIPQFASAVSPSGIAPQTINMTNIDSIDPLKLPDYSLSCLGTWNEVTYTANNGNLERATAGGTTPTVAGVVNIQAQYGISATPNSNRVIDWVDASGGTWATPTVADRNRIKAIRIAVVARNSKTEPENVTTAALNAWQNGPVIDLSTADTDWQRYRYRIFETILPLRNVIWAKDTL